ncbi:MAG: 16S rRNA (adenine(1518)-N(6)/adenine(1519)-N(6)) -dimethyltransferase RsmA [Saprospiraceae bacterium]
MKAKKSFGQHFLNREDIAQQIADSLQLSANYQHIVEVGPGQGMLTKYLLEKDQNLFVVEADKDMVSYLNQHYPSLREAIIFQDFLKMSFEDHLGQKPFGLIGNFPYNISSQIVFKMLDNRVQIPEMVGMFQHEMAARVVAAPGSKTYGVISVLTQAYYEGEYLFLVDRSCFSPPPKVQSAVIRLTRKKELNLPCDDLLFKRVVKQSFSQRRKMLRNTLKPFIKDPDVLQAPFFTKRPEVLSVEDFISLTQMIEAQKI